MVKLSTSVLLSAASLALAGAPYRHDDVPGQSSGNVVSLSTVTAVIPITTESAPVVTDASSVTVITSTYGGNATTHGNQTHTGGDSTHVGPAPTHPVDSGTGDAGAPTNTDTAPPVVTADGVGRASLSLAAVIAACVVFFA
jgi:hypothetical protein